MFEIGKDKYFPLWQSTRGHQDSGSLTKTEISILPGVSRSHIFSLLSVPSGIFMPC